MDQQTQAGADTKPPETEQARQAQAQAGRWKKRLKYFSAKQKQEHGKRWERNREAVNGDIGGDGDQGLVRVNLIASVVNTIQPNIYAKAPEVAVQPQERLDQKDYANLRPFARTLELALNRYAIRGGKLKARGKEAVRAALTCTTGWVKAIYQKDRREDPLVRNRLNDAQDNIQRTEQLLRETKDQSQCAEYEAKMAELRQQVAALKSQLEIVAAEGIVIDNVPPERIVILDASVTNIDEYDQASAIAHGIFMTVAAYKAQFAGKEPPKKATRYRTMDQDGADTPPDAGRGAGIDADDELVLVWEIWSKDDQTVYTQCDGADEFCRDPYQPERLGQQWYPFFPLQLWRVHGFLYARTLVDNIIELVDEYNTRRTTAAEHRRKNMPVRLLNRASGITDEQISTINQRGNSTDIVGIDADPNVPLAQQLGSLPEIPYNPQMYDTQDILRDVEMVSGAQDASRGGINQAKTATEAEIMAMGMQSRTGEQLDTIEDWLTAILSYCAELLLLNLTEAQVKRAFGNDAVWPTLSRQEIFEQVLVTIRAGSTSKPNKMRERDQWLQFLPMLQDAVLKCAELQDAGKPDLAEALVKLLDETLRRFDERMSARDFIPGMGEEGEEGGGSQAMLQAMQKKVQEAIAAANEELQQQRDELAKGQQELQQRDTDLQVREIQFKANEQVANIRHQYEAKALDMRAEKAGDSILGQVQDLLRQHEQRVQQLLAGPNPQQAVQEAETDLRAQVDGIVQASGLEQPEPMAQLGVQDD